MNDTSSPRRLFPTAAELGAPPVPPRDADLSRIRVYTDPNDPEWLAYAARRAERKAKYDAIQNTVSSLVRLGAL